MQKFIVFLIVLFASHLAYSGIYKWKDKDGNIQYSDVKPETVQVETIAIKSYNEVTIVTGVELFEDDNTPKRTYLARPKKVVMYSTKWCGYCKKAKAYFKKNSIAYTEYDIEKSRSAKMRYNKLGATGIPVILVGKKRMNGFNEKQFDAIYQ